ncbi:RNA polymerase I-specific transcription initiation factor [Aureococcus anophagefferens]|nr:RNA polymerase I-specific transcription initiation factor [Aureococcus anophagefferens]
MASEPRLIAFRKSPRGLLLGKGDVSPYECVIVRGNEGKQKPGFPKGKIEPVDGSILGAALRETWEEAGLKADQLRVLPASAEAAANASVCLDADDSRMFADDEEVMLDETSDVIVSDESPAPAEDFPDLDDDVDAADLDRDAATTGATPHWLICTQVDVNAALLLLERKRRAALRRAVLIFAADERALATQATRDQAP